MKLLSLQKVPRSLLIAISLVSCMVLLSSCGGGGSGGGGDSLRGEGGFSVGGPTSPDEGSRSNGSGCFATVLNSATYEAIPIGMARSQVLSTVKCSPAEQGFDEDTWRSEEFGRAELTVYYYNAESSNQMTDVFAKYYRERLSSVPSTMPSPVAATCTSQHINQETANSIREGLDRYQGYSQDAINKSIGCAPSILERHIGMSGIEVDGEVEMPAFAIYTWRYIAPDSTYHEIYVAFREVEDTAVGTYSTFD